MHPSPTPGHLGRGKFNFSSYPMFLEIACVCVCVSVCISPMASWGMFKVPGHFARGVETKEAKASCLIAFLIGAIKRMH